MMVRLELEAWLWTFLKALYIGDLLLPSFVNYLLGGSFDSEAGFGTRLLAFSFSLFIFSKEALVDEKSSSQEIRILVHIAIFTTSSSHR